MSPEARSLKSKKSIPSYDFKSSVPEKLIMFYQRMHQNSGLERTAKLNGSLSVPRTLS